VWSASVEPPAPLASHLIGFLSDEEHARAARFVSALDRNRFVAGRAFLRLLLARHAGAAPGDLQFRYGAHGKPALAGAGSEVRFNLAHSGALAVCAVAHGIGEVGVDVEGVRPVGRLEGLARTALSPREAAHFSSLPEPVRLRAFYDAWTRKEAFLKALGCGLDRPLDSVEVSFGPGEPPRLLGGLVEATEAERFWFHAFEPEVGYVGAVAVAGFAGQVRHLRWCWS
jgi:4'-phosphopantetheinyl transferase